METSRWLEVIVGSIILAALGFYGTELFKMEAGIATLDTKEGTVAERVEKIAQVLPDIRVRVAQEEVSKPIQVAVVTTKPVEIHGDWLSAIHVFDPSANQRFTYVVKVDGPNDSRVQEIVGGSVYETDSNAVSLMQVAHWSEDIQHPAEVPSYVAETSSFLASGTPTVYMGKLSSLGVAPTSYQMNPDVSSWPKLSAELTKHPKDYKVKTAELRTIR